MSLDAINIWRSVAAPETRNSAGRSRSEPPSTHTAENCFSSSRNSRSTRRRVVNLPTRVSSAIGDPKEAEISADSFRSNLNSEILVRISQHSGFERDLYLRYPSSLSSRSIIASLPLHQDSGLGASSPPPDQSNREDSPQVCIVPDSQSLPGSSSYVPTSSVSGSDLGTSTGTSFLDSTYLSIRLGQATGSLSEDEASRSDPIEESSGFYVAESPESNLRFRRSRSFPTQSSTGASTLIHVQPSPPATLLRSHSEPGVFLLEYQEDSTDSYLPEEQERQGFDLVSSQEGQLPQTQRPIPGETRITLPTAQIPSQFSAEDSDWNSIRSPPRRHIRSASFRIFEDCIADSQPTQTTDNSILSQRHPNSQPDRVAPAYTAIESDENYKSSSTSLEFGTIFGFSVFDSTTPPRARSFSGMSEQPSTPMGIGIRASSETPRSGLRQRLKNLRASSKLEADGLKLNKRIVDQSQSQSASTSDGLGVRSSLSQSFGGAIRTATPDHPSAAQGEKPARILRAPVGFVELAAPTSANPPPSENPEISLPNKSPNSATANASVPTPEDPTSGEHRIRTQRSEIPADVPLPLHVTQPEPVAANLSGRQPLPTEGISTLSQETTSLQPIHLGPMEFVVPLSMKPRVRDHYISIINYYHKAIEDSQEENGSDKVLKRIESMLDRLDRVTTHMDLESGDDTSQEDIPAEDLVMWAKDCSEKFKFLHHLLDSLRNSDMHLAIVARSGQLLNIVETFLKGVHVAYNRPDVLSKSDPKNTKGRVEVTLLPSGIEGSTTLPSGANLVVALDGSFNAQDPQVAKLRAHVTNVGQLAPVIHLLVHNSAEHIGRCIPTTMDPVDRVKRIVSCLTQIVDEVGQLLPDEASPSAAAEEVAAFIGAGARENDWTLPSIRPIEGIVAIEHTQGQGALAGTDGASRQKIVVSTNALKRALVSCNEAA